jgi:hypothetical protein
MGSLLRSNCFPVPSHREFLPGLLQATVFSYVFETVFRAKRPFSIKFAVVSLLARNFPRPTNAIRYAEPTKSPHRCVAFSPPPVSNTTVVSSGKIAPCRSSAENAAAATALVGSA